MNGLLAKYGDAGSRSDSVLIVSKVRLQARRQLRLRAGVEHPPDFDVEMYLAHALELAVRRAGAPLQLLNPLLRAEFAKVLDLLADPASEDVARQRLRHRRYSDKDANVEDILANATLELHRRYEIADEDGRQSDVVDLAALVRSYILTARGNFPPAPGNIVFVNAPPEPPGAVTTDPSAGTALADQAKCVECMRSAISRLWAEGAIDTRECRDAVVVAVAIEVLDMSSTSILSSEANDIRQALEDYDESFRDNPNDSETERATRRRRRNRYATKVAKLLQQAGQACDVV